MNVGFVRAFPLTLGETVRPGATWLPTLLVRADTRNTGICSIAHDRLTNRQLGART
jgi:hypothetical protein